MGISNDLVEEQGQIVIMKFLLLFYALLVAVYAGTSTVYLNLPNGYIIYDKLPGAANSNSTATTRDKLNDPITKFFSDAESPITQAALTYLKSTPDDICGRLAQVYIYTLSSGASIDDAERAARTLYLKSWHKGDNPKSGSACKASQTAFREAFSNGKDPVKPALLAYLKYAKSYNGCAAAALDYIIGKDNGQSDMDAIYTALNAFAKNTKTSTQKKLTIDPQCSAAAQAYISSSNTPDSPNIRAMNAFISKSIETGNSFDLSCQQAAENFFTSYKAGKSELESFLEAGKPFFELRGEELSRVSKSPCHAAYLAYMKAINDLL